MLTKSKMDHFHAAITIIIGILEGFDPFLQQNRRGIELNPNKAKIIKLRKGATSIQS
jgi:hypothetical protein